MIDILLQKILDVLESNLADINSLLDQILIKTGGNE